MAGNDISAADFFGTKAGICPKCNNECPCARGGRVGHYIRTQTGLSVGPGECYVRCPNCGVFVEKIDNITFP